MSVYVTSGKEWDAKRNTSMVHAVDPNVVPQFVKLCADARARGEEWIAWIDNGCPELTEAEYERVKPKRQSRTR